MCEMWPVMCDRLHFNSANAGGAQSPRECVHGLHTESDRGRDSIWPCPICGVGLPELVPEDRPTTVLAGALGYGGRQSRGVRGMGQGPVTSRVRPTSRRRSGSTPPVVDEATAARLGTPS
jgi:hypothetical protein